MYKPDYLLNLKSLCLFQDINHNLLKKIVVASNLYFRETNENITIHNEQNIIIILTGKVKVHMKESSGLQYKIGYLKSSDVYFPSLFLDTHVNNSILLEVTQSTTFLEVPFLFIKKLSCKDPVLKRNILRSFHKNLLSTYDEIFNLLS
ncbi:hypothetical protein COJ46_11600 [Bacillus sp. AFS077874]|uniref:Crp/Fnr family transcriptional regulator n=1 Tax=Bacillus sp. AFS077874 TaxID=2033513 RepID=UPI000BF95C74|nr:Crp/Fnr family transcriptional regulator [Bacillus sp. AFS077874]PFM79965.1 hypothetical protein COJ46_11600 [Bacillus sp. AFS077874]